MFGFRWEKKNLGGLLVCASDDADILSAFLQSCSAIGRLVGNGAFGNEVDLAQRILARIEDIGVQPAGDSESMGNSSACSVSHCESEDSEVSND